MNSCESVFLKMISFYVVAFHTHREVHVSVSAYLVLLHDYMLFVSLCLHTCLTW